MSLWEPGQTVDQEEHECRKRKEQKFHNCFAGTHRLRTSYSLSGASLHVVIFFELPRLAAVIGPLALPMKRVVRYFAERPTYGEAVGIYAAQYNAITFTSSLRCHHIIEFWKNEHNAPLIERRIKEPNRCPNLAFLTICCWVGNPQILDRSAIEYPAEMQFSFAVVNLSLLSVRGKPSAPSADKTSDGFGSPDASTLIIASRAEELLVFVRMAV